MRSKIVYPAIAILLAVVIKVHYSSEKPASLVQINIDSVEQKLGSNPSNLPSDTFVADLSELNRQIDILISKDSSDQPISNCDDYRRALSWVAVGMEMDKHPIWSDSLRLTGDSVRERVLTDLERYATSLIDEEPDSSNIFPGDYRQHSKCAKRERYLEHLGLIVSLVRRQKNNPARIGITDEMLKAKVIKVLGSEIRRSQQLGGKLWLECDCDDDVIYYFGLWHLTREELGLTYKEWEKFLFGPHPVRVSSHDKWS